jgi:hypothetical protein
MSEKEVQFLDRNFGSSSFSKDKVIFNSRPLVFMRMPTQINEEPESKSRFFESKVKGYLGLVTK